MPYLPSAQDALLNLTGTASNIYETITSTGNGTGAYYGANRLFMFQLLVAGAVSGTTPTLDIKFQDSADNSTYTDLGIAFPQQTSALSLLTTNGVLGDIPTVGVRTKPGRPYLRIVKTVSGGSASFPSTAVMLVADPAAVA